MDTTLVIDIETVGTDPRQEGARLICLGYKDQFGQGVFEGNRVPQSIRDKLADPEVPIATHSKFDARFLRLMGWEVAGPFHNTMRMAHLLDENTPLKLEWLVKHHLGREMDKRLTRSDKKVWFTDNDGNKTVLADAPIDQVKDYCLRDVIDEWDLYRHLYRLLDSKAWLEYWLEEEVPFTEVLLDMECTGIGINLEQADELKQELVKSVGEKRQALVDHLGYDINFGSGDQLAEVLFKKVYYQPGRVDHGLDLRKPTIVAEIADACGIPKSHVKQEDYLRTKQDKAEAEAPSGFTVQKVTPGALVGFYTRRGLGLAPTPKSPKKDRPSTTTPDLLVHHYENEFVRKLVDYRKDDKVIKTYLEAYPRYTFNGRLYGTFNEAGTATGRLSSSNPNLQNQPAHGPLGAAIRGLFCGDLIVGDHSQLEPRLMAHFSGDPVLLDIYRNNKDIYLITAEYIFGKKISKEDPERQLCKTLMLALGYGAGAAKLAQTLFLNGHPTSVGDAQAYLDELAALYKVLFEWKKAVISEARDRGYTTTIGGRVRRLGWAFEAAAWKIQSKGERQAVNSKIQGSAADILRRNMLDCRAFSHEMTMLLQVHDEIVFENRGEHWQSKLDALRRSCESPGYDLRIPLAFEPSYCRTWAGKGGKEIVILADEEEDVSSTA